MEENTITNDDDKKIYNSDDYLRENNLIVTGVAGEQIIFMSNKNSGKSFIVRDILHHMEQFKNIKEFNINEIIDVPKIVIIGKSELDRKQIIRNIMHKLNFPVTTVISPTNKLTGFYNQLVPLKYIHEKYDDSIVQSILSRQSIVINKLEDSRCLLILDDCICTNSFFNSSYVQSIYSEGRFYKLPSITTIQCPIGIPPEIRYNFDYVFLLAENYYSNKKRLYEHYAGMFSDFESFDKTFSQMSKNDNCMVINNRSRSSNIEDKVFSYKFNADKKRSFEEI